MLREIYETLRDALAIAFFAAVLLLCSALAGAALSAEIDPNGGRVVLGGRPAGCPHAYCGCGLRKFLGLEDTRLNLAWNWAKLFHRTPAKPGAAAVRRGHVMLLVRHVSGTRWVVRDYNGGRHLSYIHERDVRGYVFVDPTSSIGAVQ